MYDSSSKAYGHRWAVRVGIEMVASTMIGLGLGYYLDKWLGTRPWLLLLFFLFGVAAGFLNLYHHIKLDQQQAAGDDGSKRD